MKISNEFIPAGASRSASRSAPTSSLRGTRKHISGAPPARSANAQISSPAQLLARAAGDLAADQELREDAVQAARERVRDWQGLDQAELEKLADSLLSELS